MPSIRDSLAAQFFVAFAITAVLVITVLSGLVALSMRDGFSKYLVQGELVGMEGAVDALAQTHDPDNPGWPALAGDPRAWRDFLAAHIGPVGRPRPDAGPPGPPPDFGPPRLEARVFLLAADGRVLVPPERPGPYSARRPILAAGATDNAPPIGYLGVAGLQGVPTEIDAFFLRGQYRNLALAALVALAISALAAALLSRHLLRPIQQLERGTRSMAAGDFDTRLANTRRDELGQLIDHTNALAESLKAGRDAERQWVSDTSHELQTPLAVLRAEIEAVQDGIRQTDDKTLAEMHDAVMRLSGLVSDLRTLSFAQEGGGRIHPTRLDFAALVVDRLDRASNRLAAAGVTVNRDISGPLDIDGDQDALGRLVDNLLENTRRYTASPGQVRVSARRDGANVLLVVSDSSPAPPPAAMAHLFDRFFRAEGSRSRAHGGAGLGLAICRAIATAHDGRIEATASPLGGLCVTLTLSARGPIA